MMRRILGLCLLASAFLSACSRPGGSNETPAIDLSHPVNGDWAVVRFESEPENLNPSMATTSVARYAMTGVNNSLIYELLMAYNTKDWGLTEPLLAEAPPVISEDRLTYTITLRDGVKWHDGKPLTAEDVLFTFKATACPLADTGAERSFLVDIADIQIDGRSIRFLMKQPNVYNVVNVANTLAIIPKHVFDPDGLLDGFTYKDIIGPKGKTDAKIKKFAEQFNNHPANRAPIGTGPYKFEKWDSGKEIVLTRNDDYWGKKPYLDKIVYKIINDYPAALTALKAGDIDLQPRLLPVQYKDQVPAQGSGEQLAKTTYSIPSATWIIWNNDRPYFKDKRVRQAMTMLIDRQKIIDKIRLGLGTIAVSPLSPQAPFFDPNLKPLPYDVKRAGELLDEAGWIDHDGDGIRDKDGVKFKFEFLGSTGSSVFPQLAPVLEEAFRKAGIEMTEQTVEFALMTKALKEHRFDASAITSSSDLDQEQTQIFHSSSAAGGTNFMDFKNTESDRLLQQINLEFDAQKRKELYWKWQELITDEQPVAFVYYWLEPAAYNKRFQNVQWLPLRPGYDLTKWWVPTALQKYKSTTAP